MKYISILVLVIMLFISGCNTNRDREKFAAHELYVISTRLPTNYTNLKSIGNEWVTFNLEVDGQKRLFMCRLWVNSMTFIELK